VATEGNEEVTLEEELEELKLFVKEMLASGARFEVGLIDDPGPGVIVSDLFEAGRSEYEILYFQYSWDKETWVVYNDHFSFNVKAPKKERKSTTEVGFDEGMRMVKDKVKYG
jgi:hypothetical protein